MYKKLIIKRINYDNEKEIIEGIFEKDIAYKIEKYFIETTVKDIENENEINDYELNKVLIKIINEDGKITQKKENKKTFFKDELLFDLDKIEYYEKKFNKIKNKFLK